MLTLRVLRGRVSVVADGSSELVSGCPRMADSNTANLSQTPLCLRTRKWCCAYCIPAPRTCSYRRAYTAAAPVPSSCGQWGTTCTTLRILAALSTDSVEDLFAKVAPRTAKGTLTLASTTHPKCDLISVESWLVGTPRSVKNSHSPLKYVRAACVRGNRYPRVVGQPTVG